MAEGDIPFVFKRNGTGLVRQEVETGAMNDDEVVIRRGLESGDEVALSAPLNREGIETLRLPGSGDKPKDTSGDTAQSAKPLPVAPGASTAPRPGASPPGGATRSVPTPRP
jgi:hypothetical protein